MEQEPIQYPESCTDVYPEWGRKPDVTPAANKRHALHPVPGDGDDDWGL